MGHKVDALVAVILWVFTVVCNVFVLKIRICVWFTSNCLVHFGSFGFTFLIQARHLLSEPHFVTLRRSSSFDYQFRTQDLLHQCIRGWPALYRGLFTFGLTLLYDVGFRLLFQFQISFGYSCRSYLHSSFRYNHTAVAGVSLL